jgi:hypothetical protein
MKVLKYSHTFSACENQHNILAVLQDLASNRTNICGAESQLLRLSSFEEFVRPLNSAEWAILSGIASRSCACFRARWAILKCFTKRLPPQVYLLAAV